MTATVSTADPELGERSPLLTGNGEEPKPLEDIKDHYVKEQVVASIAGVSFITSVLSLVFQAAGHPTVFVSGLLGTILAPYAAIQQRKLTEVEALAETNERLTSEVDQLATENERLSTQVQTMEKSVANLQTMEETLETLQSMQGESVDELENQLEESKQILASMNVNLKSELLQNLISVMLAADANGDMLLSDEEIEDLIHQLESIHGVELKEHMLKNIIIDAGRSVAGIMELARHVLCDKDIPEDKNIFALVEEYK